MASIALGLGASLGSETETFDKENLALQPAVQSDFLYFSLPQVPVLQFLNQVSVPRI